VDVPKGFSYDSGSNTEWETVESLRVLMKLHVDSQFTL
jgi:UDP-N-acetylglucosamine 4,6-dehydratase